MADAAFELAASGFRVFPCHYPLAGACSCGDPDCGSVGKHPATPHGCKDASSDPDRIRSMWNGRPLNIGVSTDNMLVVDIDPRSGGAEHWQELRDELGLGLIETLTVRTGGGGWHYYFLPPNGDLKVPSNLGPGVDLKASGAYVVGPPSLHASGRRYAWVNAEAQVEDIPPQLLMRIEAEKRKKAEPAPTGKLNDKIPAGGRHKHLASLAGTMRKRHMAPEAIRAALLKEYELHCDHNPQMPESEFRQIARDIGRKEPSSEPRPGAQEHPQLVERSALNTMELPKSEIAVDPIITAPGLWLINGSQKVGKTILGMQISLSFVARAALLGWFPIVRQRNALFIE